MKEATIRFLEKAERAINAAERLMETGHAEFAAGRAYYAMFYAAEALLSEKGLRFRKHGGVHRAFGEHFVKTGDLDPKYHQWLLAAFDKRIIGDYDVGVMPSDEESREMIHRASEMLREVRRHLGPQGHT